MSHKNSQVFLIRSDEGETRIARSDEIVSAARKIMSDRVRGRVPMTSPKVVKDFLSIKLGALEYELFCLLLLDKRHRLIEYVELFRGTIDGALYLAMRLSIALKCL